jgi:hypothetical protein
MESFQKNHLRYLVVGGLAVNLHGVPRTTMDLDIIISFDKENIHSLLKAMGELNYVPRVPVDAASLEDPATRRFLIDEKNMKAFSFCHRVETFKVIDIVIAHPLIFNEAESKRNIVIAKGIEIPFVSIDDLITMKTASGRETDRSDIAMLLEAKGIYGAGKA